MFWDIAANFYDIVENSYNEEVNRKLVLKVAKFVGKAVDSIYRVPYLDLYFVSAISEKNGVI